MCWQCTARPGEYLSIFAYKTVAWYWGAGTGDGVCEFILEGECWHTSPLIDPASIGEALPGDCDSEDREVFVKGPYLGLYEHRTSSYRPGTKY